MKIINLKGVSKKGKARVKQFGNSWQIIHEKVDKLLIVSTMEEPNFKSNSVRWIDKVNDMDFEILSEN